MRTRIITGLFITAAFISLCLFGPLWLIYAVLQLAALIGLQEMLRMAAPNAPLWDRIGAFVAGIGLTSVAYFAPDQHAFAPAMLLCPIIVLASFLIQPHPIETVAHRMSGAFTAVFYVGLFFAALIYLSTRSCGANSGHAFLLLGGVVLLGDTGAYFMGKYLGRHKLYPAVSPKKTIEGSVGGILGGIVGALAFKLFVDAPAMTWLDILGVAVPCAILGQVGDLCESLFKRSYGVKDSGTILPGHGGVLDRMDSVLFAAPYLLYYVTVLRPGMLGPS